MRKFNSMITMCLKISFINFFSKILKFYQKSELISKMNFLFLNFGKSVKF